MLFWSCSRLGRGRGPRPRVDARSSVIARRSIGNAGVQQPTGAAGCCGMALFGRRAPLCGLQVGVRHDHRDIYLLTTTTGGIILKHEHRTMSMSAPAYDTESSLRARRRRWPSWNKPASHYGVVEPRTNAMICPSALAMPRAAKPSFVVGTRDGKSCSRDGHGVARAVLGGQSRGLGRAQGRSDCMRHAFQSGAWCAAFVRAAMEASRSL